MDTIGHPILRRSHGAKTADLTFVDGNTYRAKVIGADPSGDLAILQITDNFSAEKLSWNGKSGGNEQAARNR